MTSSVGRHHDYVGLNGCLLGHVIGVGVWVDLCEVNSCLGVCEGVCGCRCVWVCVGVRMEPTIATVHQACDKVLDMALGNAAQSISRHAMIRYTISSKKSLQTSLEEYSECTMVQINSSPLCNLYLTLDIR